MAKADVMPVPPFWQWIPLSEYRRPAPPIPQHLRRLWWRRGARANSDRGASHTAPYSATGLHNIEEQLAGSLESHLAAWFADRQPNQRLVVLPPHLGVASIMRRVASTARWRIVEPPSPAEILNGGEAWRGRLMEMGDAPLVVPALHRMFLRYADGLDRLRELLALLRLRRGPALVGCESWGWWYVHKALQLGAVLGEPLTLQALDADQLRQWLPESRGMVVDVLPQLAAESGGNVAVASALAARVAQSGASGDETNVTATGWRSHLPAWPPASGRMDTFVAHSLLIHGGLPDDDLATTILGTGDEISSGLKRLAVAGLVEEMHGTWRVTPAGYPAVRTHLIGHGYADDF